MIDRIDSSNSCIVRCDRLGCLFVSIFLFFVLRQWIDSIHHLISWICFVAIVLRWRLKKFTKNLKKLVWRIRSFVRTQKNLNSKSSNQDDSRSDHHSTRWSLNTITTTNNNESSSSSPTPSKQFQSEDSDPCTHWKDFRLSSDDHLLFMDGDAVTNLHHHLRYHLGFKRVDDDNNDDMNSGLYLFHSLFLFLSFSLSHTHQK